MSSLQNINARTIRFSDRLQELSRKASSRAKKLKLREAFLNLFIIMPVMALPWLLGKLFAGAKYLFYVALFGFKKGAGMNE